MQNALSLLIPFPPVKPQCLFWRLDRLFIKLLCPKMAGRWGGWGTAALTHGRVQLALPESASSLGPGLKMSERETGLSWSGRRLGQTARQAVAGTAL